MSKKLYPEEDIQAIANAIRTLNGSSDTYAIGDMADAIELPDNAYYLKETEADNPLVITDGEELNAQSCVVEFELIQDLHGYDNPWPAGGGKNKLDISKLGVYQVTSQGAERVGVPITLSAGTYTLSQRSAIALYIVDVEDNYTNTMIEANQFPYTFTLSVQKDLIIRSSYTSVSQWNITNLQVESGSQATDYAPYSNICPISGRNRLALNRTGKNLIIGKIAGASNNSSGEIIANDYTDIYIARVSSGTNYCISVNGTLTSSYYGIYSEYPTIGSISVTGRNYNNKLTPTVDGYIAFRMSNEVTQAQIELGQTATAYEPYQGSTHTATFPNTVYGGVWKATEGKVIIDTLITTYDKNSDWTRNISGVFYVNAPSGINDLLSCNSFKPYIPYGSSTSIPDLNCRLNNVKTFINFKMLSCDTLEEFEQAIDGLTIQVAYKLATPQEITLTPEIIELLKDNNVFTTDGKTVKVRYLSKHI